MLWLESGMSQKEWAKQLGVSLWTVHRWINGKFSPHRLHKDKIERKMWDLAAKGHPGGKREP